VLLSGQTPIDPATGKLIDGDIAEQTRQVFADLSSVLTAAGRTLDDVVKVRSRY
jgi:2-iminobutanoate/2-iminopropanoate deaminase